MKGNPTNVLVGLLVVAGCLSRPVFAGPIFSYGDYDQLRADRPLAVSEIKEYRRAKILNVFTGADVGLFDKPGRFSNLKIVTLDSPANEHMLESLARNYKHIGALCISQSSPLSASEMSLLPNFKGLAELELHCTLSEPTRLKEFLPLGLWSMWLSQTCELPRLSRLDSLTVADCSVSADFMKHLDAPNLTQLELSFAAVDDDVLESLSKFHHLKLLSLPSSCRGQRERIRKFTSARVAIDGDGSGYY
jgi:hypothetical protein